MSMLNSKMKHPYWGRLPELSLVVALGLLLVATAFTASQAGTQSAEACFWIGLFTLLIPVTTRLLSAAAARQERIGLVVLLGLALYLVKVMHSPTAFTFPDELTHLHNVRELLQNYHLFHDNPILPVTPLYPGLETMAAALVAVSGLSPFTAGIVLVGAARLILTLSLYLFNEQVSGSARVAGVATTLYMANSNFVFWSAQFAYESLALPLAALVLYAIARRENVNDAVTRVGLTRTVLAALLAVVITHHMSSYALTLFLLVVSGFYRLYYKGRPPGPWVIALTALTATLLWLIFVASLTLDYLSPVLAEAVKSILRVIVQEEAGRQLFQSSSGHVAPLWERVTGIGSVLLILLGIPFGILQIWRRHRHNMFALVLAGTALTYFPMQGLRFTPAGWETSNRASEFLFVGISFVLALGIVDFWLAGSAHWPGRVVFPGCIAIVFAGGVIAGWQPNARLAQPYLINAGTHVIEPQGVTTAKWTRAYLRPNNRIAADASNAKLLLAYGEQYPYTGEKYGVRHMFFSEQVGQGERHILQVTGVRYVVVDRRLISWDNIVGLYFNRNEQARSHSAVLMDVEVYSKFDGVDKVSRIYDSGDIVIYYVGSLVDETSIE